jgi:hypothetical protein
MATKKTIYGLKAYGKGNYVREVSYATQTPPVANWTDRPDLNEDFWVKRTPSEKAWNGTNG